VRPGFDTTYTGVLISP